MVRSTYIVRALRPAPQCASAMYTLERILRIVRLILGRQLARRPDAQGVLNVGRLTNH